MNITHIEDRFHEVEQARSEMKGRVDLLKEQLFDTTNELEQHKDEYKVNERVLDVLKKYSLVKEQVLREKIDNIITRGLRLVFGEGYRSKLEFGISRGQAVTKTKLVTSIGDIEFEADVASAHGGGITNFCAVLYKLLVLALVKPRQRQVLFLDESLKNLSQEYLEPAGRFLKEISEKLGIQLVIITHKKELTEIADRIYEFSNVNGETKVKEIGNGSD